MEAQIKLCLCTVFQNVCIIPKCLDSQRTIFQRSYFSVESRCVTTVEYFKQNCRLRLSACGTREKRQKRQLGLLKRILKQFKRSCICIYSPCDSDFWQLQSDRYMACFRSIKTKRHVYLGAFCFFTWQPSGGALYWCGTEKLHCTELKN